MRISDWSSDVCSSDLWLEGKWSGLEIASGDDRRGTTAVEIETLKKVGTALTTVPDGFNIHKTLTRNVGNRRTMIESGEGIDWATAEALAFGSLQLEGFGVRLSGQDSGRSEEHTSELQSLMRISYAVFCLKNKNTKSQTSLS